MNIKKIILITTLLFVSVNTVTIDHPVISIPIQITVTTEK